MSLEGSILWYRDAIFVTSAHRELPRNQNIFIFAWVEERHKRWKMAGPY
jgi:hypothetical protein